MVWGVTERQGGRIVGIALILAAMGSACGVEHSQRVGEPAPAATLSATPLGRLVSVGASPEGIVVDPALGLVAVAVQAPAGVIILDRQGAVVRRVALPSAARHLRFTKIAGELLVPAEASEQLIEVDIQAGRISSVTKVGHQPHDAVSLGDQVFVTNEFSDSISVVSAGRVVDTISSPAQPGGIAESDGFIAVVGVRSHTLAVVDPVSLATLVTHPAGQGPTHVAGTDDGRFIVVDTVGNALLVFGATPSLRLLSRVELAGTPYGLALDQAHRRLFVTLTGRNQVVEYDVRGDPPVELGRFPTPRQPNSIAVDAASGTIFVTGTADRVVQIVSSFE